ncbi:hypothetical protein RJ639_008826 [Escallonia herrerae]|uniref:Leucine zipper homeobox-associated domain-containing protein n=1 Tax=Escallonia herrerae TaxID=1293975 RepID=A0AA89AU79_9ASTE|nr:hypothetical protein RJ639_008826 [Escallonia herrerae]
MMVHGNDDLGLSLSLAFPENRNSQQLNRMPSSLLSSSSPSPFGLFQKAPWNEAFPSSDRNSEACRVETRSFLKGIDVNRLPSTADIDDEAGVSSPNSTISSVSGKRSERDANGLGDDPETERACSRGLSDDEDGDNSRKKLRLSKDQTKLKQTEVDCEFLKRLCENLTEENRRLQKEVQELRTLKLSPQFYMQMTPPTTLTMCPSCERVAVPPSSSSAAAPSTVASVDPRSQQAGPNSQRSIPFNPWAMAAGPHRPFDALRPRS